MKKCFFLLISLLVLNNVNAQVPNDDCQHAQLLNITYNPYGSCLNGMIADTTIQSSNNNSIPNYPYPANPDPCDGYTPQIAVPANDVWYEINASAHFEYLFYSSDTTHVSFWIGDNCSALRPYKCFTFIGNGYNSFRQEAFYDIYQPDRFFVQISGNRIGKFINFSFCFWNYPVYITMYSNNAITPVLCFNYKIKHTDVSNYQANDGSAAICINGGNAPFTYQWNDGNTDSIRTNLSVGEYYVTITDNYGCKEIDSLNINTATYINANTTRENDNFFITPIPSSDFIILSYNSEIRNIQFEIIDLNGHIIKKGIIINNRQIVDIRNLTSGLYFVKIINGKTVEVRKIIKEE